MLRFGLTLGVVVCTFCTVHAQSTIYTSSATFLSQLQPGYYSENFNTLSGTFNSPLAFNSGAFSYTANAGGGDQPIYTNGAIIGNTFENQAFTFSITSGNVTAIGGTFLVNDINDIPLAALLTITLSDGTTTTFTTSTNGNDFRGFVSPGPVITSLTLSASGVATFNSVNDFTVGISSAVPEPGTISLVSLVGAGAGIYWYRQRRKTLAEIK